MAFITFASRTVSKNHMVLCKGPNAHWKREKKASKFLNEKKYQWLLRGWALRKLAYQQEQEKGS